jgi:hypothetical protein
LFILQMIYKHGNPGERYWQGNLPTRPLAILTAKSSGSKSEETRQRKWWIWPLSKCIFSYFDGIFNILSNVTTWGRQLYFPSEGRRAADFYRPRPGLNLWTLDPMASTLAMTWQTTTGEVNALVYFVRCSK